MFNYYLSRGSVFVSVHCAPVQVVCQIAINLKYVGRVRLMRYLRGSLRLIGMASCDRVTSFERKIENRKSISANGSSSWFARVQSFFHVTAVMVMTKAKQKQEKQNNKIE